VFFVPIPESWDPAEHGWRPAETKIEPLDAQDATVYLLRFAPPLRFPASLALFRNPASGQRVAWYGPLATESAEQIVQGPALATIGISPDDWGPEDRQPEVSRHG
jgi:hypothetical protein